MSDVADRVAKPGDPDLDCDIQDLVLTSVLVEHDTRVILARGRGGHGRWYANDDEGMVPIAEVHTMDLTARLPDMPTDLFDAYRIMLERWRDTATPIRVCMAPGRATLLIDPAGGVLPWPRRTDPLGPAHADH